jgi:hypothetical protein
VYWVSAESRTAGRVVVEGHAISLGCPGVISACRSGWVRGPGDYQPRQYLAESGGGRSKGIRLGHR